LNLAQALCLYAYSLSRAPPRSTGPRPRPSNDAELRRLEIVLDDVLKTVRFVRPGRAGVGPLMAPWRRSGMTRTEARLWEGAIRTLARSLNKI
jgi:tRNA (cytidine32/uridine32-2'-O)-methyltransferase